MKKETQPRSNVLSRFLDKAKNEPEIPYDTSSFLSAGKRYIYIHHALAAPVQIPRTGRKYKK